jgi:hypothetical protein
MSEVENKEIVEETEKLEVEIVDDTPEEDKDKTPMPKEVVDDLENDELEEYSTKAKERIRQAKKVYHDERREKERFQKENAEAMKLANYYAEENKKLKESLSKGEENYISTYKAAAELELGAAKKEYKDALESYDNDAIAQAQEKLTKATLKLDKAENTVPTLQNSKNDVKVPESKIQDQPPVDPKYADWASRNSWFQKDPEMTYAAMGVHQKLAEQHGSQYIGTDEYYQIIDKTMKKRFPDSFADATEEQSKNQRAPNTVVAPAKRSTASKKLVLNHRQAALAKKFKLTPEQYAKEVLKLEGNV